MRKVWLGVSVGIGVCLSFVVLLVLGTYMVAANLAGGGGRDQCRPGEGRGPGLVRSRSSSGTGNSAPPSTRRCSPRSSTRRAGGTRRRRARPTPRGMAQFIPGTWASHGVDGDKDGKRDIWDPNDAIPSAAAYDCSLAKYVKDVPGDLTHNMLPPTTRARTPCIKYRGVPPYRETQNYVKTITHPGEELRGARADRVSPRGRRPGRSTSRRRSSVRRICGAATAPPEQGGRFDCSGLTKAAYETVGIELPRVANDQYNAGPHPKRDELLPGDLVFFSDDLDQLPGHPPRGDLRGRRVHDQRALHWCGDPLRPDRHPRLLRGDAGDQGWRESVAHDGLSVDA